ncbi:MAG: glycosyltransferase family A protein [Reichenbachiella sp.]|uniref:glycosyltransferase family 2 protein n=1 Tax=Reichenbachiella sp. TaxID=2184521 RepID=UPI003264EFF5
MQALVSIIMPAYNAAKYVGAAIQSVLDQSYNQWELIIVNDGSRDNTDAVIRQFSDDRIVYFEQENMGVSGARNKALSVMRGDYFCFLDADDLMPTNSISSRIEKFRMEPNLSFVDGKVIYKNADLSEILKIYLPSFNGEPFDELVQLKDTCLFGNTWMVKNEPNIQYVFTPGLTHAEDLSFYLSISKGRKYSFVEDEVLWYRRTGNSAMTNLKGLENGYVHVYHLVKDLGVSTHRLNYLKRRITRIMSLSWLIDAKNPIQSVLSFFRMLRL